MTERRADKRPWLTDLGCWLLLAAPLAVLFAPVASGDRVLAMRDGSHYYFPLWQWIHQKWRTEDVPAWNPYEQGGVSLASDPTACLWYPGQLLFAAFGRFGDGYHAFLATHLLLAAGGAFRAARRGGIVGASRTGALIAGLAYGYGAPVLFLYSNPIYLVGAAWLPWSWSATARMLELPNRASVLWLAFPLAMTVLGGDPQMAYHVGLIALGGVVLFGWPEVGAARRSWFQLADWSTVDWSTSARRLAAMLSAAVLAGAISAVQVLPTWQALDETLRWNDTKSALRSAWARPVTDTHDELRYHFSVGPWRWPETMIPNFAGRMFPRHARWMSAVPAEGRVWTPSLYLGTLPVVFALGAVRLRRRTAANGASERESGDLETRWLTWVTLFAILAGCGWFGLGWLLQELRFWMGGSNESGDALSRLGPQVGGSYWALVRLMPGYELFRYPAKWWTVVAFGVAMLAARGWDRLRVARRSQLIAVQYLAIALTIVGVASLAAASWLSVRGPSQSLVALAQADPWLGPFDWTVAAGTLMQAAIQTLVSSVILSGLVWMRRQTASAPAHHAAPDRARASASASAPNTELASAVGRTRGIAVMVVAWIALDLVAANHWMLNWLPARSLTPSPRTEADEIAWGRIYRPALAARFPATWSETSSDDRLVETHEWERCGRYGKLPLLAEESVVSHDEAWGGTAWRELLDFAVRHGERGADGTREPPNALLDLLAVRERTDSPGQWRTTAYPAAWLVRSVDVVEAGEFDRPATNPDDRLVRLLIPHGEWRDFRATAAVETRPTAVTDDESASIVAQLADAPAYATGVPPAPPCPVLRTGPCQLSVEVATDRPALLVVGEAWSPGWSAVRRGQDDGAFTNIAVYQVNGVMRGVAVPQGRWRIEFRYEPRGLRWGGWISVLGCVSMLGGLVMGLREDRRVREHGLYGADGRYGPYGSKSSGR